MRTRAPLAPPYGIVFAARDGCWADIDGGSTDSEDGSPASCDDLHELLSGMKYISDGIKRQVNGFAEAFAKLDTLARMIFIARSKNDREAKACQSRLREQACDVTEEILPRSVRCCQELTRIFAITQRLLIARFARKLLYT